MDVTPGRLPLTEAQGLVARQVRPLPAETVPLSRALGRVPALGVACDMDYPPFDKAMMDGYAVRSADFAGGSARLEVLPEIAAGDTSRAPVQRGQAVPINTGAPMPEGTDTVVPVEFSSLPGGGRVVELRYDAQPGRHVVARARDIAAGDAVLPPGTRLGPAEVAALAAAGATAVSVHRRPVVAVLTTGDELVTPEAKPAAGQIRDSNSHYFIAAIGQTGAKPDSIGNAPDEREALGGALQRGLQADVLFTIGGISMGKCDLVGDLLAEMGVRFSFRKVAIKPGMPTLFGTHGEGKLVFALPGNPGGCFVAWHLLAGPALLALQGAPLRFPATVRARTVRPVREAGDRQTFLPAYAEADQAGEFVVRPVAWTGSGDVFGLVRANALIVRSAGAPALQPGAPARIVLLELPGSPTA